MGVVCIKAPETLKALEDCGQVEMSPLDTAFALIEAEIEKHGNSDTEQEWAEFISALHAKLTDVLSDVTTQMEST